MRRFFISTIIVVASLLISCTYKPNIAVENFRLTNVEILSGYINATWVVDLPSPLPREIDLHSAELIVGRDTLMSVTLREPMILPAKSRQVELPVKIRLKLFEVMAFIGGSSERDIQLRMNATARIGRRKPAAFTVVHAYPMKELRETVKNYLTNIKK